MTLLGWTNKQDIIENTVRGLVYDQGQRVIPVDVEGGGKGVKIDGTNSSEINRQAALLKDWLEKRPEQKINLLGQSMSALTVLVLIDNYPELSDRIDSMIFVSPMGLGGKKGFKRLASGFLSETMVRSPKRKKNSEDIKLEPIVAKTFIKSLVGHPIRHIKEVMAMASADEYEVLYQLKERGIKVGIIQSVDDLAADNESLSDQITERATEKSTRLLTQEEFEKDPKYLEHGFSVGDMVWNDKSLEQDRPPIDILMELEVGMDGQGRGHGISGPRKLGGSIVRLLKRLKNPITEEQAIAFNQFMHAKSDSAPEL